MPKAVNKVVLGNNTLIDLTSDTVSSSTLLEGYTAHDASGAVITGTALSGNPYSGSYLVTPSESQQVLPTADSLLSENVVIEAIPTNYGKITWDGSALWIE